MLGARLAEPKQAGLDGTWGLDKDRHLAVAFGRNFPAPQVYRKRDSEFYEDYLRHTLRYKTDILHLSPPCQPFSGANTSGGSRDDENRECLDRIINFLRLIRSRVATFENVPSLKTHAKHRPYFDAVLRAFTSVDYSVGWKFIDCADYGVPQKRKRLFVIASR